MRPSNGLYPPCLAEDVRLLFGDNVFEYNRPKIATLCSCDQSTVTMCASHCVPYNPAMSFAGRDFHAPSAPLTTGHAISTVSLRGLRRPRGRAQVHTVPIMESSARTVSRQGTHHGLRRFPTAGRFPWLAFFFRRPRFWSARLDIASSPWLQSSADLRRSVLSFSRRSRARALSTSAAALAGLRPS